MSITVRGWCPTARRTSTRFTQTQPSGRLRWANDPFPPGFAHTSPRRSAIAVVRGVRDFPRSDLPPGEVEVRVGWSSVNYKDGLATRADGRVARISPLIPGIDLAGEVVASRDRVHRVGTAVLAHGYDLASRDTAATPSTSACLRVGWSFATGSLAARCHVDRDRRLHCGDVRGGAGGSRPPADGPVLVTGASVGSAAPRSRSSPSAATRSGRSPARPRRPRVCALGATGILSR